MYMHMPLLQQVTVNCACLVLFHTLEALKISPISKYSETYKEYHGHIFSVIYARHWLQQRASLTKRRDIQQGEPEQSAKMRALHSYIMAFKFKCV